MKKKESLSFVYIFFSTLYYPDNLHGQHLSAFRDMKKRHKIQWNYSTGIGHLPGNVMLTDRFLSVRKNNTFWYWYGSNSLEGTIDESLFRWHNLTYIYGF